MNEQVFNPLEAQASAQPAASKRRETLASRLRSGLKEAIFFLYLYSGYVALRDFLLACLGRSRAVVLYYHRVGGRDVWTKPNAAFRDELAYLKSKYECLRLKELCNRISVNQPLRRRSVVITFDDGYRDNFTEARPALQDAGLTATFFVATGFIATEREFPHDERARQRGDIITKQFPKLTWEDLRQMEAEGFEIGSHTINHTNMGSADTATIEREVAESLIMLNRELGEQPRAFSFPWGKPQDLSDYALEVAKRAGYYAAVSAYGGANTRGANLFKLRRVDVGNGEMSRLAVRARMAGFAPDYYQLKMKKFFIALAFLIAFLGFAVVNTAHGKTIYVAKNGSDKNSGTLAQPLATPAQALNHAEPGDTIYLRAGRYPLDHFLWVDKANLTIASNPGEKAAIVAGIDENEKTPPSLIIIVAHAVTLVNLEVEGGSYYGVKVDIDKEPATRGVTIRNCYIHGSGRDCIKTFNADHLLIEGCEIGPSGLRDPSNAEGIDSIGSVSATIRTCYVHDTATTGIYLKGGARDSLVERNRVERCRGAGILLGQDTDEEFMRDKTRYECLNSVARNNIIADIQAAGIGTYSGSNLRFENNTIYEAAKQSQAGFYVVVNSREVPAQNISFKNNIVVVSSHRPVVFLFHLSDPLQSDYNIYYGNRLFRRESKVLNRLDDWTFPDWKKGLRVDEHSVFANPLLDEENLYKPRAGSPAFDRGESLLEVKTDFSGIARPQGAAYDIGAYEGRGDGTPVRMNDEEAASVGAEENASSAGVSQTPIVVLGIGVLSAGAVVALAWLVRAKYVQARGVQPRNEL
ncbi:MAG: polysaccharide deacetylase family protein [Acidobacteria bacterium]|nr:polysaccharide deacetylase family protein [Acidobacteriota bacterium]